MKRDNNLDVLRCCLNYMVVLLHAYAAFQYVARDTIEFYAWKIICSYVCWIAIPCFFLISGYLLFRNYSLSSLPQKLLRRLKRLLVPYVAWNFLFVCAYLTLGSVVPRLGKRVATFGLDTFSGAFSKIVSLTIPPIDGPLWFLRTLLMLSVLSPLIWFLLRFSKGVLAMILCALCIFLEWRFGVAEDISLVFPAYSLVCFLMGGAVAVLGRDIFEVFKNAIWIVVGVMACSVGAILGILQFKDICLVHSICAILEAPTMISAFGYLHIDRISSTRWLCFFKGMGFFAYAGHFLFCSIWLHSLAPLMGGYWHGKFTVLITIFVVLGMVSMIAVYYVGKKLVPRVIKVFDGTL